MITEKESPTGDIKWALSFTGWSQDKLQRLCRRRLIPGSYQTPPGRSRVLLELQQAEGPRMVREVNDLIAKI